MIQKLFVVDHVIKIIRTEVGDVNPSETQYISEPSKFFHKESMSLLSSLLKIKDHVWVQTHIPWLELRIRHPIICMFISW